MISFELFDKVINAIKAQDKIDDEISKALELVSDSHVLFNTKNKQYEALNALLKEVMNDRFDYIPWFIYEGVKKEVTVGKKKIDVSTTKKLYDFLVKYYGD